MKMDAAGTKKILVLGGGIAGLAAANALRLRGAEITLLERAPRVGGNVRTIARDGFLAEAGPNSFIAEEKELFDFLRATGVLDAAIDVAPAAKKRFIVRGGRPVAVPSSPLAAVTTPLFSLRGKLRLLGDLFVPRGDAEGEETVAHFVRRRIGREMYDYALNPLVAGIFAGDPEKLAVRHAFPKVWNLDQKYGSLIRGTIPNAKAKKASGLYEKKRTLSFPRGMETLPKILAKNLGRAVRVNATLTELAPEGGRWRARWFTCGAVCDFFEQDDLFDAVVAAVPPREWRQIFAGVPALAEPLARAAETLAYPPVTTLTLGFRRGDVAHPLDGFGALVPEVERRKILGSLWTSSLFPNRAPEGRVTLTTYVGGSRQPELARLPADAQLALAREELSALLGARGAPEFVELCAHDAAIPQYDVGYGAFLKEIEAAEKAFPNLRFCGNYRGGIAVGATLLNAVRCARVLEEKLKS